MYKLGCQAGWISLYFPNVQNEESRRSSAGKLRFGNPPVPTEREYNSPTVETFEFDTVVCRTG